MNAHSPPTDQDHFQAARQYQEYYDNALRPIGLRAPSPVAKQYANDCGGAIHVCCLWVQAVVRGPFRAVLAHGGPTEIHSDPLSGAYIAPRLNGPHFPFKIERRFRQRHTAPADGDLPDAGAPEITTRMVDTGLVVLADYDPGWTNEPELVARISSEMFRSRF
jgi:hypothetical protein